MRLAGVLTALASAMAALVFALLPTSVPLMGDSCGPPAARFVERVTDSEWKSKDFAQVCWEQSLPRLYIAGALLVLGVGSGAALIAMGWPSGSRREQQLA